MNDVRALGVGAGPRIPQPDFGVGAGRRRERRGGGRHEPGHEENEERERDKAAAERGHVRWLGCACPVQSREPALRRKKEACWLEWVGWVDGLID